MKKIFSFLIGIAILSQGISPAFAELLNDPIDDALSYAKQGDILRCFEPRHSVLLRTAKFDIDWARGLTVAEAMCGILEHAGIDRRESAEKSVDIEVSTEWMDVYHVPFFKEAIRRGIIEKDEDPNRQLMRYEALKMILDIEGVPILKVLRDEDRTHEFRDVRKDSEMEFIMMTSVNRDIVRPASARISGAKKIMLRGEFLNALFFSSLVMHADFFFEKPEMYIPVDGFEDVPYVDVFVQPMGDIPRYDVFLTMWEILSNNHLYSDKFDAEKAMDLVLGALPEVLDDPYTSYLDYDENESFQDSIRGDFEGIGAYISKDGDDLIIVSPIKKTPADKAGLKAGDIVLKIDGEETADLTLQESVKLIKGPRDTKVTLTIKREHRVFPVTIVRARVEIPAVEYEVRDNNVLYINIYQFSDKTEEEFKKAVDATKSHSISAVVIDLRNNPGGLLHVVENLCGYFVPKDKTIVQVSYRNIRQEILSQGDASLTSYPIAILINKGSASASEILAGAVQDYGMGKIVGVTSFGKGTVQEILPFFDGSSFRYTVAEWLTPNGHSIQDNGITPDIEAEDFPETEFLDEAYERAVDELIYMNRIPGVYVPGIRY
jgi:carboxyl-terminal processing protease